MPKQDDYTFFKLFYLSWIYTGLAKFASFYRACSLLNYFNVLYYYVILIIKTYTEENLCILSIVHYTEY